MKHFFSTFCLICALFTEAAYAESGFYEANTGIFSSLGSYTPQFNSPSLPYNPSWSLQLHVGYAAGKFIGLKRNYAEVGAFIVPQPIGKYQPFADLKAYRLNGGCWASSLGVGMRWWQGNAWIWGVNFYYDYRDHHFGSFNRLGFGFELLGYEFGGFERWNCACMPRNLDFRLNFYVPLNNERERRTKHKEDPRVVYHEKDFAFKGVDFEAATRIWEWNCLSLEGGLGPYYYHNEHKNFIGAQARLSAYWTRYFLLEGRISCDKVFKTHAQGKITLNIPLFELICGQVWDSNSVVQPVQRNGIIFTKFKDEWRKHN